MELFEDIERVDSGPASHGEDSYTYYSRSARPTVARVRELLQGWFDRYPAEEREELFSRLRVDFDGAFFELFLHEMMLGLEIDVAVHPELPTDTKRRPDFKLAEEGSISFLEARVARDESIAESKKRRVLGTLYDQINALHIPDFFLQLADVKLRTGHQPSTRRFGRDLKAWLDTLDYEDLVRRRDEIKRLDDLPRWSYRDDDVSIALTAIPVSEDHRGAPGHRPIGIYPMESRWGGSKASLRKALKRKGSKFGRLSFPYIVAVNSLSWWGSDRIDQMEALFGSEQFVIGPKDTEPDMVRMPNGFWRGPRGSQNTRVSAVLCCQVAPWNVHEAQICLYHNPWAAVPYEGRINQLARAVPVREKMIWIDGVGISELLQLAPDWLGED